MRKEILLACACVLCLSACGTGANKQSKNPQKALEVGAETTPKSVEATSSPTVQKIKNTSGKRENPKDLKQIKLSVERWDTKQKDFSVQAVRFGTGSGCVSEFGQNWEFISYKENLQTVQKKNPSYFVELTDYLDENHTKYKAARYFKNNNSYVLYERSEKGKKHNYLCLENQMLTLEYPKYMNENQKYISFPYPSCKSLSDFKIEESWEKNEDFYEKEFWQLYSYADLKVFYQNFEKGTAECSDKTQTILVKAMEHDYDNKTSDASVLLDFKNHNFIVKNPQGKKIFDKNDVWKAYEKQYTSAGKFGSKEFFYNKSSVNIYVWKKEKERYALRIRMREIPCLRIWAGTV